MTKAKQIEIIFALEFKIFTFKNIIPKHLAIKNNVFKDSKIFVDTTFIFKIFILLSVVITLK